MLQVHNYDSKERVSTYKFKNIILRKGKLRRDSIYIYIYLRHFVITIPSAYTKGRRLN